MRPCDRVRSFSRWEEYREEWVLRQVSYIRHKIFICALPINGLAFVFCIAKRLSWDETFPGACLHRIVSGLFRLNFLNGRSLLQSGRNDDDSRPFRIMGRHLTTLWREGI